MTTTQDIMALELQRRNAMVSADTVTLSQIFSETMVWIHGTSRADSKKGVLASIASGKTIYRAIDCYDETVRIYADTAIVSGLVNSRLDSAGEIKVLHNRFTIVWANIDNLWQVVNWQSTTVPKASS